MRPTPLAGRLRIQRQAANDLYMQLISVRSESSKWIAPLAAIASILDTHDPLRHR